MRTTSTSIVAVAVLAALTACSNGTAGVPSAAQTAVPADVAVETSPPSSTAEPAEQHGNAASNKVCLLATVAEVERLTGYKVWQVDGLNPGYRGDLTCVWRLTPVDYGAPSFSIVWDDSDPSAQAQADYFRTLVKNGERENVEGFGDVATTDGSYINIISGDAAISFNYRVHQVSSQADMDVNLTLLRLVYPRTELK
ncbi:hypothetical protein [Alloactinosynnema sp. L-07]|uniref:DUF3558 domain-containing protein n=1 Tax=Alloactinosynnema sp. L-07 TaxID=1653480 RepID=UPI00065F00F6|nr:DUF3558 domain-containing protein [Alloactinosynnema sp. L-07]CRK61991.1 hypothetical protein [Alloactinosynnema sp. L-07]